jgi:predicted ester cyclase
MPSADLRARREAVVREHMASENAYDFDTTIATFGHPRYELVATGDVYDGEDAVRAYFAESRRAFPDQRNELVALHHADDAVIVEFDVLGTHLGPLRALPPTGRAFRCRMVRTSSSTVTSWSASASTSTSSRSCASSASRTSRRRSRAA